MAEHFFFLFTALPASSLRMLFSLLFFLLFFSPPRAARLVLLLCRFLCSMTSIGDISVSSKCCEYLSFPQHLTRISLPASPGRLFLFSAIPQRTLLLLVLFDRVCLFGFLFSRTCLLYQSVFTNAVFCSITPHSHITLRYGPKTSYENQYSCQSAEGTDQVQ